MVVRREHSGSCCWGWCRLGGAGTVCPSWGWGALEKGLAADAGLGLQWQDTGAEWPQQHQRREEFSYLLYHWAAGPR